MSCDYSWQASAKKYMELYHKLKPKKEPEKPAAGLLADEPEEE
jgi:hypothetical protein